MPSVGFSAIARIVLSPMCWATSQVIVVVTSSIVTSTVSALLISGSSFGGNATSTTGPITRTTRPPACARSPAGSAMLVQPPGASVLGAGGRQRFRPPDDLHDLGRDLVLPRAVRLSRQDLDELLRVVGRGLHRPPSRGVLRRGRLEHRGVDLRDDVL